MVVKGVAENEIKEASGSGCEGMAESCEIKERVNDCLCSLYSLQSVTMTLVLALNSPERFQGCQR